MRPSTRPESLQVLRPQIVCACVCVVFLGFVLFSLGPLVTHIYLPTLTRGTMGSV